MSLIVKKFGGTSVANAQLIFNAANTITKAYQEGNDVVVVVSAQGSMTDELVFKASEINPSASKREMDVLLSSGEQISIALLAMAIEKQGFPVVSLLGWQCGMLTSSTYGSARIKEIDPGRIKKELDKKNVVVVAGFQGLNQYYDVTTLGRGGSDTSAVAIASALSADLCQIYTDVEGVFTADPRKVPDARKLDEISYDEMLEMSTLGAHVLNNRAVEMAKKYKIELEVISSFVDVPGTIVKERSSVEKLLISGVTKDENVVKLSLFGVPDEMGWDFRLLSKLSARGISIDMFMHATRQDGARDVSFTVKKEFAAESAEILRKYREAMSCEGMASDPDAAKVSIVGAGLETQVGVAAKMFQALYEAQIAPKMISTSETKISVIVPKKDADRAVSAVHGAFFPGGK